MVAARFPWRIYLALVLAAVFIGLGAQWAFSSAAAAPEFSPDALPTPRSSDHVGSATFGGATHGPTTVPYLGACAGASEPTYGLIDPCLPRQSPFDP